MENTPWLPDSWTWPRIDAALPPRAQDTAQAASAVQLIQWLENDEQLPEGLRDASREVHAVLTALAAPFPYSSPAPREPVTFARLQAVSDSLQAWMAESTTRQSLTWPPSIKGLVQAAAPLFAEDSPHPHAGLVLAWLRPDLAVKVLSAPFRERGVRLSGDWMAISRVLAPEATASRKKPLDSESIPPAVEPSAPAPDSDRSVRESTEAAVPPMAARPRPQAPAAKPAAEEAPAAASLEKNWLSTWLDDLYAQAEEQGLPVASLHALFDGRVKEEATRIKGAGARARNYWFEDVALPALCGLSVEDQQRLLQVWPPHLDTTFNDPVDVLKYPRFWRALRAMPWKERHHLLESVLPTVVDSSAWTHAQRLEMLEPLLDKVTQDWMVKERLDLWKAWGGNLDAEVPVVGSGSADPDDVFTAAPMTSARRWLADHGLEEPSTTPPAPRSRSKPR